jgi:hypothetical protein
VRVGQRPRIYTSARASSPGILLSRRHGIAGTCERAPTNEPRRPSISACLCTGLRPIRRGLLRITRVTRTHRGNRSPNPKTVCPTGASIAMIAPSEPAPHRFCRMPPASGAPNQPPSEKK